MGTNNTGELTSPSSISLARQTLESLVRVTTPPCLPSFLALPLFLPIVHRTVFAWSQLQQGECQWQRAYRRRPTALETTGKMTETETCSSLATVYACTVPGGQFPAKYLDANQSY